MDKNDLFQIEEIIKQADVYRKSAHVHLSDVVSPNPNGGANDYYSNGDYWWPDPERKDGLPYIRRDGESNPNNFHGHRQIKDDMVFRVTTLAAAYKITKDEGYGEAACAQLKEFFVDKETRMNPNLQYAQAIPGVCSGRGIGIIDTTRFVDITKAIKTLEQSCHMTEYLLEELKKWFRVYSKWMLTHGYGIEERYHGNNHSICYYVQIACFGSFIEDEEMIQLCKEAYAKELLPDQMAQDGSMPLELARTKPYNYSYFALDNLSTLAYELGMWDYTLEDGRSLKKGFSFFIPYMEEKEKWPYQKDVQYFDELPVASSMLVFAYMKWNEDRYKILWNTLPQYPQCPEVKRSRIIWQPILWI